MIICASLNVLLVLLTVTQADQEAYEGQLDQLKLGRHPVLGKEDGLAEEIRQLKQSKTAYDKPTSGDKNPNKDANQPENVEKADETIEHVEDLPQGVDFGFSQLAMDMVRRYVETLNNEQVPESATAPSAPLVGKEGTKDGYKSEEGATTPSVPLEERIEAEQYGYDPKSMRLIWELVRNVDLQVTKDREQYKKEQMQQQLNTQMSQDRQLPGNIPKGSQDNSKTVAQKEMDDAAPAHQNSPAGPASISLQNPLPGLMGARQLQHIVKKDDPSH